MHTDRIYNCGFTNCAVAIGSDITTDSIFITYQFSVIKLELGCITQMQKSMIVCSAKILELKLLRGIIPHTASTALISAQRKVAVKSTITHLEEVVCAMIFTTYMSMRAS